MRKIIIALLFYCAVYATQAQVKYAIQFGGLVNKGVYKTENLRSNANATFGAFLGGQLKVYFENPVFFAPQLNFLYKNSEFNLNTTDTAKLKISQFQIHLAPLLQIDLHSANKPGLYLLTGLSLYTTLIGNQKITNAAGSSQTKSMEFGFRGYDRFEANLNFGIGWESEKKIFVQLMYNYGLSDTHNADNGPNIKYQNISLGIGYFLGGKLNY